ncbi:HlyD family efflux transporter periplasmic adaptor subunit [Ramlibacter sp. AW1]|uniref:HlyD family efflux transporter periplasmic adaptor subunit n=1 Tax=Ramlibacter aurantiacus TaxID=2801330 RepID=A0A936ZGI0_9BURK|nr:HlyD family efflux transporter periplasmic adaptor subunit [Ramlibacter aurantiacus]MBL0419447.1 HlyD family efflux transporter periplasmic adaptor subunit [Ramlibacter aurantiacus]
MPKLSIVATSAAVLFAALLALLYFAEYTRRERVTGIATTGLGAMRVYAPTQGAVVKRLVNEGEAVREGQPLLVLSSERNTAAMGNTHEAIATELSRRRRMLESEVRQQVLLNRVQSGKLSNLVAAAKVEEEKLDSEIGLTQSRERLAESTWKRYQTLVESGFASETALTEKEQELIAIRIQVKSLERQRDNVRKDSSSFVSQIGELQHRAELEASALNRGVAELQERLAETDSRREIIVLAKISGTVTGITVDKGQVVDPSAPLLAILPHGETRDVQLYVPSRAIGFISPGTAVMVRFDAFPYQKFGQYRAVVRDISRAPLQRHELQTTLPTPDDYFRVWAVAERSSVSAYGRNIDIQNGMRLEADLLLESRRIYEWVLEPLLGFGART